MKKISFTKMVASGNDFVVIHDPRSTIHDPHALSRLLCDRKYGIGADGLLVLGKSKRADLKMRIFNSDGSEAEMCGNGARCTALYRSQGLKVSRSQVEIETRAGIIKAYVTDNNVKIKLTDPKAIKLDIPIRVNNRYIKVNSINTGVPHTVIFVEGLDKIDVVGIGRKIRYHREFFPAGTNVDFVEILSKDFIKIRTYERGVEDETLACGTGSVASALLSATRYPLSANKINVHTAGGEILKVYFSRVGNSFHNIWLEGKAKIVYKGEYYV